MTNKSTKSLTNIAAEIAASGRDASPGVKMMIEDGLPPSAVISLDDRRRERAAKAPASNATTTQENTMTKTTAPKKAAPKKAARAAKKAAKPTAKAAAKKTSKVAGERPDGLRPGSKQAMMVDMVLRKEGATEAAICAKLAWKKCRVTLKRVCDRIGAVLSTSKDDDGKTVYRATLARS